MNIKLDNVRKSDFFCMCEFHSYVFMIYPMHLRGLRNISFRKY